MTKWIVGLVTDEDSYAIRVEMSFLCGFGLQQEGFFDPDNLRSRLSHLLDEHAANSRVAGENGSFSIRPDDIR